MKNRIPAALALPAVALMAIAAHPAEAKAVKAHTEACHATSDAEIARQFDRWNSALATLDPDKVVARYAPESILLPTVSNTPRTTPELRKDYFTMFLKSKPQGVIDSRLIQVGCNSAIDAGIYTFTFGDGRKVQARYTFTYGWNGKDWLITSHHSSAMPEQPAK
ncbi:MAG: SgcJ/EcaC family oxidoreductase [Gammaproteobacteria bacterium]|nr:SgcJ/EcaC family oxidoreductase [Gammaproteobacteria bacterium]